MGFKNGLDGLENNLEKLENKVAQVKEIGNSFPNYISRADIENEHLQKVTFPIAGNDE